MRHGPRLPRPLFFCLVLLLAAWIGVFVLFALPSLRTTTVDHGPISRDDAAPSNDLVITDLGRDLGSGAAAQLGELVKVKYTGKLTDGQVFDSGEIEFKLGNGEVIEGWEQGVKGMRVGGQRQLIIPPKLAYGDDGSPPDIPPAATLIFDVELLRLLGNGPSKDEKTVGPIHLPADQGKLMVMTTRLGELRFQLRDDAAPKHCSAMREMVRAGLYDGCVLYRAEPGFVVQGGLRDAEGSPRHSMHDSIELEYKLRNTRGTVAMARGDSPDSGSGDFFINLARNAHLDKDGGLEGGYALGFTVWAEVESGMDVADAISALPTRMSGGLKMLIEPVPFSLKIQ